MMPRVLVVCIGNSLVGDDAAGYWVFRDLATREPFAAPNGLPDQAICTVAQSLHARLVHLGLGGLALLDLVQGEELLVVIDAVQFGALPGTIHELAWEDIPRSKSAVSCHGIGVREAIELGRAIEPERMPQQIVLMGIEGDCFHMLGEPPCAAVQGAIGPVSDRVLGMLRALQGGG